MAAEAVAAAEGITAAKAKAEAARVAAAAAAGGATGANGRPRRHTWAGEQLGRLEATLVSEKPFKLITRNFRLDMSQAACLHISPRRIVPAQGVTSHPCTAGSRVVCRPRFDEPYTHVLYQEPQRHVARLVQLWNRVDPGESIFFEAVNGRSPALPLPPSEPLHPHPLHPLCTSSAPLPPPAGVVCSLSGLT